MDKSKQQNLGKLLNLFQANYLLSEFELKDANLTKRVPIRQDKNPYYLYKLGSSKLVELLAYKPLNRHKNWQAWADKWMESPDPRVLIKAIDLPTYIASKEDSVEIIEQSISPARLKLKVDAAHPVPILIKMSYFPRWHAYEEGKRIKIYQVAPSLMLVYGKGNIELKYEHALVDYLGYLLTLAGIGFLLKTLTKKH